jgi:hypothetical protein
MSSMGSLNQRNEVRFVTSGALWSNLGFPVYCSLCHCLSYKSDLVYGLPSPRLIIAHDTTPRLFVIHVMQLRSRKQLVFLELIQYSKVPCADRLIGTQVIQSSVYEDQSCVLGNASGTDQASLDPSTHPLNCLDILDMILSACVGSNSDYCELSRVLSQVCRVWRTFIVSSPKYWTVIKMRCGSAEGQHLWAKALLDRSQSQPITFHLYISAPFHRDEVKRVVCHHAGRIHKLIIRSEIDVPPTVVWIEFQLFMSKDLELFDYRQKDSMRVTTVRDPLSSSHSKSYPFQLPLTSGLECAHLNWSTWQMKSITSLTLDYLELGSGTRIPNRDLCAILSRNLGTLEHLEIIDHAPIIAMLEYPYVVTLPRLKSLSIGYVRAATLVPFVETLRLPALRSLSMRDVARAPELSTPKHLRGVRHDFGCLEGGLNLLTALHRFETVTHLRAHGVRCHEPSILMDELALESLTLVDSDDLFCSLICSVPAPINGWKNNSAPGLTRSGLSITEFTVTSHCHELFVDYLTKRLDARCPPLRRLTLSPCCLHSAFADNIKESKWDAVDEEVDIRIDLAMQSANTLKVIPQPLVGIPHSQEEADLLTSDRVIDKEALWQFVPDIILSTEDDSDDEMIDEDAPWAWLAHVDSWDMEL